MSSQRPYGRWFGDDCSHGRARDLARRTGSGAVCHSRGKESVMKTLLGSCALGALLALSAPQPSAAHDGAGLGIIVGEPTGVSAKIWVGGNTALDAAAAWSFADEGALHLHGDFLAHAF